jgi:hypothetical protein
MIEPTVGRVVWYWDRAGFRHQQPQSAQIAYVHSDVMVNLGVMSPAGEVHGVQDVAFWDGEGKRPPYAHWEWMPYQKGQAAKTEQLAEDLRNLKGAGLI